MSAPLCVRIASKHYAGRRVLEAIEVSIAPGEIVALVGPSGCGKSTLLRIVAGLEPDFEGTVSLGGTLMTGASRAIGVVFQEPRLFPWLNVAENVAFASLPTRGDHDVLARLDEVGLKAFAQALPKQLSGGQAQRVAIARALYAAPQLLLLDEPFSAVDALTRMRLQELLLSVAARRRLSVLLVTHDIDEAVFMADRVLILDADPGRLRGAVEIGVSRPRDRRDPDLAECRAQILSEMYESHAL